MSETNKIPSAEVVPLADRMRYMQAFRFSLVPVVALAVWITRNSLETGVKVVVAVTAIYLLLAVLGHVAWRASSRGGLFIFTAMLLSDGVYLAWTSYATGSGASPVRYLILLHIIAVALLASYRTGMKMALWHTLLLLVVYYAQEASLLHPLDPGAANGVGTPLEQLVVYSAVFWFVALATSTFSAINERELRRRRFDLEALAAMAVRLEDQSDSASVAHTLLDCVVDTFDFDRALFFTAKEDEDVELLAHVGDVTGGVLGPPPDVGSVIHHAMATRSTQLVARADVDNDLWLSVLVPDAKNLVIVPLSAEGHAIGALVVEHGMRRGSRIERRVVGMLERFASHGALALRNAWLLEQVQELAATDGLTGIANRYTFQNALERELERAGRSGEDVGLAMLDIDHFKRLNDAYGHQAGDEVLRRVAVALSAESRTYDTIARYGGEEFALILPATDRAETRAIVDRLRRDIAESESQPSVTISAGMATFPTDASTVDELIAAADEALYESKREGRNRVHSSSRHANAAPAPRTPLAAPDVA
jgi:two-component system, cell cycle response regulator